MNEEAFRLSLITARALNCEIAPFTKWDRKQYYYPDLPKGYQISQYDLPFSHDGWLEATTAEGETSKVRILRAHLEEDAGKNLHDETGRRGESRVDLNRAGTPLLEIVSEPDIRSAAEAKSYLEELHLLLTYLAVSDCNMQEGSLRCDANVNLHVQQPDGTVIPTPIVEIKNLNSFRGVEAAIEHEIGRQVKEFEKTGRKLGDPGVSKETRGWDADAGVTRAQRGKEEASDYRYFPDPDLVPVTVSGEQLQEVDAAIGVLPQTRRTRMQQELGLSEYDASVIIEKGPALADYFDALVQTCGDAKQAANWVTQDVLRELNERRIPIDEFPVSAALLGEVLKQVVSEDITVRSGRDVFIDLLQRAEEGDELSAGTVDAIIDGKQLRVVRDTGALQAAVEAAIAESPKAVEDLRAGKQQAIGPLVGKVMRTMKGADPKAVREVILAAVQTD